MNTKLKNMLSKWQQYKIETAVINASFTSLVKNLVYLGRINIKEWQNVTILADSLVEVMLLRLLMFARLIPKNQVYPAHYITRTDFINNLSFGLVFTTLRICTTYYEYLPALRKNSRLVVV